MSYFGFEIDIKYINMTSLYILQIYEIHLIEERKNFNLIPVD